MSIPLKQNKKVHALKGKSQSSEHILRRSLALKGRNFIKS